MYRMCGERETVGMCDVSQPVQEKWLQEQGLRIEKSDGDGHCMYHSIASQLTWDSSISKEAKSSRAVV